MPTYEYECKSCSHNFEVFQAMSDQPLKDCPECGKEIRRLIFGGAGVIFKGSGFYVNDKSKSGNNAGGKSNNTEKTDTKTETKTEQSASASPCKECPNKGVSASCPA
ncbi:MAG: zinc ribbon domain-containing protein [Treponema sp.]|nr:zinc ribbon domain-containing protein [Treponema sp.]